MDRKKLIITIVLVLGAIFSIIYGMTAQPKGRRSGGRVVTQSQQVLPSVIDMQSKRRAARTKYTSLRRSVFAPKGSAVSSSLELGGIMWDKITPKAMIGGEIVRKGDKIGSNTVVEIKRESVILNDGTKDFELKLG